MSRNEDFDNAFWSTPVVEDLSPDATLLYIWSWTNPRCGMAGLYEVGRRAMTESKVSLEQLDQALAELADVRLVFYVENVLWVVARVKRLRTKTVQMAKAIAKDVAAVRESHPLRAEWLAHHRDSTWLHAALSERRVNLTGTSHEPQIVGSTMPSLVSLTRTSPEVPLTGLGQGNRSTSASEQQPVLTRERVTEVCGILAAVERWDIDEAGVENAIASEPLADPVRAAHVAATWGSDPSWSMGPAASLRSALRKLAAEKPKVDEKAERRSRRTAALTSLMASTEPAA